MTTRKALWRRLYEGWMEVAIRFAEVQTLVLVTIIYGFVMGPMATLAGLARQDLLDKRTPHVQGSAWREADSVKTPDLERAKRLF